MWGGGVQKCGAAIAEMRGVHNCRSQSGQLRCSQNAVRGLKRTCFIGLFLGKSMGVPGKWNETHPAVVQK